MNRTVALHTLGCKLNYSETTAIGRLLEQDGFVKKDFNEVADLYIINTCSVTDNADKECRQLVRRIQRKAPEAMVVITGCYAQLKPKEIAEIPGVDLVLGAAEKFNISQHLKGLNKNDATKICSCDIEDVNIFNASFSLHERTRVFLKVQDGCNYNCSFCTIPMARGKSRSDSINNVLENVKTIAAGGAKEIVLTGINLGDYSPSPALPEGEGVRHFTPTLSKGEGVSPIPTFPEGEGEEQGNRENLLQKTKSIVIVNERREKHNFFDLIKTLDALDDIQRYRISSIEPNLLSNEIIEFVSNSRHFMPHFHIPLQSGSNKILGAMRRRYKRELYAEKVGLIKTMMPHACIGVDVIVGFPGETDEDFNETVTFLTNLDITYLHVFTYSERDNTHAISLGPVVPIHTRNQRNKILRNLSYQKLQDFTNKHIGQTRKVLFEGKNKQGMMEGYSDNYIKITTPYKAEWENEIVDWMI